MKKNVLMMLAGAALLCACQPSSKNITISGTLTGVESDTLLVTHAALPTVSGGSSATKLDTVALLDGKFSLTLECDTLPIQAVIFAKPAGNKMLNMTQNIRIVAFPNDALTVNGSLEDYKVEGSDFYASLNEAEKAWQPTIDSLQTILKIFANIRTRMPPFSWPPNPEAGWKKPCPCWATKPKTAYSPDSTNIWMHK